MYKARLETPQHPLDGVIKRSFVGFLGFQTFRATTTPGAVVAILRVVEKLSPKGDQEIEDENVESLQAAALKK